LKRFIKVFVLVAVLAGVLASTASALAFADQDYIWPTGGVGESYFKQLIGRTDLAPCYGTYPPKCSYSKIAGQFPPGIGMSSDGKVTGTPTQLGTWSFWLQINDCCGQSAQREFSLTINRVKLKVATQSLPAVVKGTAYAQTVAAEGGAGTKNWSVTDGKLPDGLSLNSANGAITGTPTTNGDFVFTVKVADASPSPDTKQLLIRVVDPLVFGPLSARARVAEVGIPFSATLTGTGGTQPYVWAVSGNLPAGLAFDPASGVISGVPSAAGLARLNLTLTDANGFTNSVNVGLTVVAPLKFATKGSITVIAGRALSLKLVRQGGARPFKWAVVSGKLPKGVGLNKRTGTLAGIPSTAGTYRFRISVTDALGGNSTKPLVFSVRA
jgi:hypothetical protein